MYKLIIEDEHGNIADEFLFDEGSYSIGRVDGNDIILPDSTVSRQHSRLFIRNGTCFVEDLGSSNGVIVDGQKIQGERDLGSAAQIRIGKYYLYLEFNKESAGNQQDVVSTHIVSQDENAYKLVRVADTYAGECFVLSERRNSIGRTEDNTVFLNDRSVSRRHAQIDVEGVIYYLADLGSSNGTCINDNRITSPTILKEGDRVSFGNLDFIFIPNNETINPADYAKRSGSGFNIAMAVGALGFFFIAFLVLVALIFAAYILFKQSQPAPEAQPPISQNQLSDEDKVNSFVDEGRAKMQKGRYEDAIESFDKALGIDPENEVASSEKKKAINERNAQEKFAAGMKSKENGDYEAAKSKFKEVPEDTSAHSKAQNEIKVINQVLAGKFKNKGEQALSENDLKTAREAFMESIKLKCDNEVFQTIKNIESKMKRKKKLRRFTPFKKPPQCR